MILVVVADKGLIRYKIQQIGAWSGEGERKLYIQRLYNIIIQYIKHAMMKHFGFLLQTTDSPRFAVFQGSQPADGKKCIFCSAAWKINS